MCDVSAVEDLMKEHGILNRVLLIYDEVVRRLRNNVKFDLMIVYYSALIVRKFVEDYHEVTEEKYVFPVLEKNNKYNDIVRELYKQHKIGRRLTGLIMKSSRNGGANLMKYIELFIKMYRQHEAFEDTVVFPAFKKLVGEEEYKKFGEMFEKEEDAVIGEGGFEKYLEAVMMIEKYLGIHDLVDTSVGVLKQLDIKN